ncbi:MAG: Holliday junction resolvase RuvX [Chloroflexi bacterium]|nr:Holliday junction resolvase RuvX [Chloroflexota bacterium]MDA1146485.1 Holliday junction resolvase RuvX [Chloroflexota bacterium]PKB56657.1 MAG: Holliday junction resolvase RuvX [SAR202 cluster bacterium Casp-Chloro-G1]
MRWLAVDPGEARVGLAICDAEERFAVPLEVVPASAAFPAIRAIVAREEIAGIVVGLPLLPSGDEGDAAAMARKLGDRLARKLGIDVVYEDERLTSVAAERQARDAGSGKRPSDDLAASILLDQFLAQRRAAALGGGHEG